MADAVKCCICSKYEHDNNSCDKYPKGIPNDILLQIIDCKDFIKVKKYDDYSLPTITKGF